MPNLPKDTILRDEASDICKVRLADPKLARKWHDVLRFILNGLDYSMESVWEAKMACDKATRECAKEDERMFRELGVVVQKWMNMVDESLYDDDEYEDKDEDEDGEWEVVSSCNRIETATY